MRFSLQTDYALRTLMFLASRKKKQRGTIAEVAGFFRISEAHVAIVVINWRDTASPPKDERRGSSRGFGGPIVLNPDDVPAYPEPPMGFDRRREDIPHGQLGMIGYDSKTVGTRRKMQVYTPPGYTSEKKYPVQTCGTSFSFR